MLLDAACTACGRDRGPLCPTCVAALTPVGALPVAGLDAAWALVAYDGAGRDLVRGLKFANRRAALTRVARAAARLVDEPVDLVTWVPADPTHRRERGYDQGALLARAVGRARRTPVRRTLRRHRGRAQTGLDRRTRLAGPEVTALRQVPPTVLVVDDVVTTGASLRAAATVLRAAGAHRVLGLALAATPSPIG